MRAGALLDGPALAKEQSGVRRHGHQCRHLDGPTEPRPANRQRNLRLLQLGPASVASAPMEALDLLPYLAAGLMLIAGASKVRHPDTMSDVLETIGLKSSRAPLLLGLVEIVIGAAALVVGGFILWGVIAAFFLAFATLLALLYRNGADISCGCFGRASTPIGPRQITADLLTAGFAAVGVFSNTPGLLSPGRGAIITVLMLVGIAVGVPALRHLHTG